MQISQFEARSDLELGDRVRLKENQMIYYIKDILAIHSVRENQVYFKYICMDDKKGGIKMNNIETGEWLEERGIVVGQELKLERYGKVKITEVDANYTVKINNYHGFHDWVSVGHILDLMENE